MKRIVLLTGMMISMLVSSAVVYHTNNCDREVPVKLKPKPPRAPAKESFRLLPGIIIKF